MSRPGDPWQPTTHAEKDARIAELEADDANTVAVLRSTRLRAERAEARIAAVIAKFDGHHMYRGQCIGCVRRFGGTHYDECDLADIRAAATGDPT